MATISETKMDNGIEVKTRKESSAFLKKIGIYAAGLLVAFLLGLIPMWLSKGETVRQLRAAQTNLRLSQLQNRLAAAAINARRGEYEPARVAASDFYTDLRTESDSAESALTSGQIEAVKPILVERDEVITLLARNDPAAGDKLADLYLTYIQALNPALPKPQ